MRSQSRTARSAQKRSEVKASRVMSSQKKPRGFSTVATEGREERATREDIEESKAGLSRNSALSPPRGLQEGDLDLLKFRTSTYQTKETEQNQQELYRSQHHYSTR